MSYPVDNSGCNKKDISLPPIATSTNYLGRKVEQQGKGKVLKRVSEVSLPKIQAQATGGSSSERLEKAVPKPPLQPPSKASQRGGIRASGVEIVNPSGKSSTTVTHAPKPPLQPPSKASQRRGIRASGVEIVNPSGKSSTTVTHAPKPPLQPPSKASQRRGIRARGVGRVNPSGGPLLPFDPLTGCSEAIKNIASPDNEVTPVNGGNGDIQIRSNMVIKADKPEKIRQEHLLTKYLERFVAVPETKLLTPEEVTILKENSTHYAQENRLDNKNVMIMAKVKGVTFAELIQENDLKNQFNGNIEKRMEEIGYLAACDMLIGNTDRLVRLISNDRSNGNPLLQFPMANTGNWMYNTNEDGDLIEGVVAIDNNNFDVPEDDKPDVLEKYVSSFISYVDKLDEVSDHILLGLGYMLSTDSNEDPEHLRKVVVSAFNVDGEKKVSYDALQRNVKLGLQRGWQVIKKSDNNLKPLIDQVTSPDEALLFKMIASRVEALKHVRPV